MGTDTYMNDEYFQISKATEAGREAFNEGLTLNNNPHVLPILHLAWIEGWKFEEEQSFADACEAVAESVCGAPT